MIGEIVGILTDRNRHSRERHNSNFPSDVSVSDPWEDILEEAARLGFSVDASGSHVSFSRSGSGGWDCGSFANNEGGAEMAREFLRGI